MADKLVREDLSVPMSVLDRILKMSTENSEAYAALVSAMDSISSRILDLGDQLEQVQKTIDKEQLAKVIHDSMTGLRAELTVLTTLKTEFEVLKARQDAFKAVQDAFPTMLSSIAECVGDPKYNVFYALSESLKFEKYDEKGVQELAGALSGLLVVVAFFRARRTLFTFLAGMIVLALLSTAGEGAKTAWDIILGFVNH